MEIVLYYLSFWYFSTVEANFSTTASASSSISTTTTITTKITKRYPCWPSEFKWSYNNTLPGYQCLHVIELSEPIFHFWYDNYLCAKSGPEFLDIGWEFSQVGPMAATTMKCVNTYEYSSPHYWYDNYICVPKEAPYNFRWSSEGCIKNKYCIQIIEPGSPYGHTWWNNYLCHDMYGSCAVNKAVNETLCLNSSSVVQSSNKLHMVVASFFALLITMSIIQK